MKGTYFTNRQTFIILLSVCLFLLIAFIYPNNPSTKTEKLSRNALYLTKINKVEINNNNMLDLSGQATCLIKYIKNDLFLLVSCKYEDTVDYERISELVFQPYSFNSSKTYDSFSVKIPGKIRFYTIKDLVFDKGIQNSYLLVSGGLLKLSINIDAKFSEIITYHKYPEFESVSMTTSGNLNRNNIRLHFGYKARFIDDNTIRIIQYIGNDYYNYFDENKAKSSGWFEFKINNGKYSNVKPVVIEGIGFAASNRRTFIDFLYNKIIFTDGYSSSLFLLNTETNQVDTFDIDCIRSHKDWNPVQEDSILFVNGLSKFLQEDLRNELIGSWKYTKSRIREFIMIGEEKDSMFGIIWEVGFLNVKIRNKWKTDEPITRSYLTTFKYQNSEIKIKDQNLSFPMSFNSSTLSSSNHIIFESAKFEVIPKIGCVYYQTDVKLDSFNYYVLENPNSIKRKEFLEKSKQWYKDGVYEKALFFYKFDFEM